MLMLAWKKTKAFWRQEDGLGMLEMILIIAVIIIIAVLFREQLYTLVTNLFQKVNKKSEEVFER